ncbi:MAG: monovalent cation/H+ antiporter subunit D, partial [Aquimonas sp.]
MNHAPIVPIVLPALVAGLMLVDRRIGSQRALAWLSALLLAGCGAWLVALAGDGWRGVYLVGNWAAPWGIVLVADRLSAMMVALTALLSLVTLAAAHRRWDERGEHFHPLLQVQLMGLNGAFLTGDLFNLFGFFEGLL